jgi:hypothetical protein
MNLVIREINLDDLILSPHHVRKDPGDLTGLADSAKDIGYRILFTFGRWGISTRYSQDTAG